MLAVGNAPDDTTPSLELEGVNVPEFYKVLQEAAAMACGYHWKPVVVWQNQANKRHFIYAAKGIKPTRLYKEIEWKAVVTITPHAAGKSR